MPITRDDLRKIMEEALEAKKGSLSEGVLKDMRQMLDATFPIPGKGGEVLWKSPGQVIAEAEAVRSFAQGGQKWSAPFELKTHGFYYLEPGQRKEPLEEWRRAGERAAKQPRGKAGEVVSTQFATEQLTVPMVDIPRRRLFVADLFRQIGTDATSIEYAQVLGFTNTAAGVAEGGLKPQSSIVTQKRSAEMKTVATWIPVSEQAIQDVPQLAAWLDGMLEYFIGLEEEDQILNGTGGNDLTGILETAGILSATQAGGDTTLDAFRKALTKLETAFAAGKAGFVATGAAMNPTDWEEAELLKDTTNRYILIPDTSTPADGTAASASPRIWRVPVARTPAIAQGTTLIGAFDVGATLYRKGGLVIKVTNSHEDFFIRNLLAMRAETRLMMPVFVPAAFLELTLT